MNIVLKTHVARLKLIILCCFFAILLTGCTVEYNLKISSDGIVENVVINENKLDMTNEEAEKKLNSIVNANTGEGGLIAPEYKIKKNIDNDNYGISLTLDNIDIENTISSFINNCYDDISLNVEDDYYVLSTGNKFSCFDVWNMDYDVQLSIEIDGDIIESNAETIDSNVAIWTLSKDKNNELYLKYSLNSRKNINKMLGIITSIVLLIIVVVISLIVYFKNKNVNKI